MHRIDSPTAEQDKFGPGKHGYTEGDPLLAIPPTSTTDDAFNALQEEPANVIEGVGMVLDKNDNTQLAQAIEKRIVRAVEPSARHVSALARAQALVQWSESGLVGGSLEVVVVTSDGNGWMWVAGDAGIGRLEESGYWWNSTSTGATLKAIYGAVAWVTDKSRCVFVGAAGFIIQSEAMGLGAALPRVLSVSGTTKDLRSVCRGVVSGVARLVAVGHNGTVVTGTDTAGATWALVPAVVSAHLHAVRWRDDGIWLAVGAGGTVLRSLDGLTWHVVTSFTADDFSALAAGEQFVAVTKMGAVWVSHDGLEWEQGPSLPWEGGWPAVVKVEVDPEGAPYVAFVEGSLDGCFVAVDPRRRWGEVKIATSYGLKGVACGGMRWVFGQGINKVHISSQFLRW